jgi:hypothetical protein
MSGRNSQKYFGNCGAGTQLCDLGFGHQGASRDEPHASVPFCSSHTRDDEDGVELSNDYAAMNRGHRIVRELKDGGYWSTGHSRISKSLWKDWQNARAVIAESPRQRRANRTKDHQYISGTKQDVF